MEYKPLVLTTVKEVQEWRLSCILNNKSVGLVPTMGALHEGHLSLIKKSLSQNHCTIISIFVNPSQFAPHEDLNNYPRTINEDIKLISEVSGEFDGLITKVDAIFLPSVNEMYPSGISLDVNKQTGAFVTVLGLSEMLEGKSRPNFFRGVATVVSKLFIAINPNKAYFGQKDYQQSLVIKKMVKDLLFSIEIVVVEIFRDEDGLALSSRNKYLDSETIEYSKNIYRMLSLGKSLILDENVTGVDVLKEKMITRIQPFIDENIMKVDYISINDKEDLSELENVDIEKGAVISCAIFVTNKTNKTVTRLIDNILI